MLRMLSLPGICNEKHHIRKDDAVWSWPESHSGYHTRSLMQSILDICNKTCSVGKGNLVQSCSENGDDIRSYIETKCNSNQINQLILSHSNISYQLTFCKLTVFSEIAFHVNNLPEH